MKSPLRTVQILLASICFASLPVLSAMPAEAVLSCAAGGTCVYGDTGPGGGKVFITPSTAGNSTGKYFELAPASTEAITPWCGNGAGTHNTNTLIGTATGIGTGKANTDAIVAFCGGTSAADSATAYRGGGFSDWFLPSKDELNAIYWNLKVGSLDTFSAGDVYTSSSESTTSTVWMQDINELYGPRASSAYFQRNFTKVAGSWYPIYTRPVRMFNPGDVGQSSGGSSNNDDQIRRDREEKIRKARDAFVEIVKHKEIVKNSDLSASELTELSTDSLVRINQTYSALTENERQDPAKIFAILKKYQVLDKLEAPVLGKVYAHEVVSCGIIPATTPEKSLLIATLKHLDSSLRDTPEKIAALVAEHTAAIKARQEHLAKFTKR